MSSLFAIAVATDLTLFMLFSALLIILGVSQRKKGKGKGRLFQQQLPGPRQYPLGKYLNLWEFSDRNKSIKVFSHWVQSHGPAARIMFGPFSMVALYSPDYIQKLYGSFNLDHFSKPFFGYGVHKPVPWFDGLIHTGGTKWKSRRKLINPILSPGALLNYVPAMNECGRRLVSNLELLFHESGGPQPIFSILLNTTFGVFCKTAFGIDIHDSFQTTRGPFSTDKFLAMTKRYLEITFIRVTQPWLGNETIFRLHPLSKELDEYYNVTREFILHLVKKGEREGEEEEGEGDASSRKSSLLKGLISAGLPFEGIYEEILTMILAGHDTTGGALHNLLFFLALNPEIQDRCQEEVDHVFENEVVSSSSEQTNIGMSSLKSLGYLEQCAQESMRLVPPAFLIQRELSGPLKLDEDLTLPAGTAVAVWLPAIHMNPDVFPNPQKFDPNRFSPEEKAKRHPYSYIPFAAGPRKCVGLKFAMMEILVIAAHILRNYTIYTPDRFEEVVWLPNTVMTPQRPMNFLFEKRRHF